MKIDVKRTNLILKVIAAVVVVGAAVWCIWLNDAQRIVVAGGAVLGLVNLLGLAYFFNKNMRSRR